MVFSSLYFSFIFMPIFFLLYYLTKDCYKNYVALAASIMFYFWGAPQFVLLVFITMLIDWHLGKMIYLAESKKEKKYYLILNIAMNVALLAYFKYANFFVENVYTLMETFHIGHPGKWTAVVLPIGISFIVFEKITYCVDIYRAVTKPAEKITNYLLYVFLFPQLIAGPIIQYHQVSRQLSKRRHHYLNFKYGLFRFARGLVRKVWIADILGGVANKVFAVPASELSMVYAWIGVLCYALQIYFDFSGYADMAIGMLRMMGIKIGENFNMPYISKNITEFWRRWHISLGNWMKTYLYIPLGGNRVSKNRNYFNLVFVFFISGMWHGANWTFIIWGIYHGLFLLLDRVFWVKLSSKFPKLINVMITFFVVNIGWVLFRSENIGYAWQYMGSMFDFTNINNVLPQYTLVLTKDIIVVFIIAMAIIAIPAASVFWDVYNKFRKIYKGPYVYEGLTIILLILAFCKMANTAYSPFIYFRF
jgi:alginate O-acetyltransferase complex protein AlgI